MKTDGFCDDQQLRCLFSEDQTSKEYCLAAQHVQQCETCQQRLADLAGEPVWWNDVRSLASEPSQQRWHPDTSWVSDLEPKKREPGNLSLKDLLGDQALPSSHPELLGRLEHYEIEGVIGTGGMGVVLKAHDTELNRPVAIKVLATHLANVGAARQRFAREGRAIAAVVHEHVVSVHSVASSGEVPYLVMQYVSGTSLQERVDKQGPLAIEEILRIGSQVASGLAAAHEQGLVHRDVKPANILLERGVERAVLSDFGLARAANDASLTLTGFVAGTPYYMSPEQSNGSLVDHRSDLFSLGAVLYFMATGHPPFQAESALGVIHQICHHPHPTVWHQNKDVPNELSDLIDSLLEKNPEKRFSSAKALQKRSVTLLSQIQRHGLNRRRWRRPVRSRSQQGMPYPAAMLLFVAGTLAILLGWFVSNRMAQNNEQTNRVTKSSDMHPPINNPLPARKLPANFLSMEREYASELQLLQDQIHKAERGKSCFIFFEKGTPSWEDEVKVLWRELGGLD